MEDSLPPEDRLPREDACSMDEFNERLPAQPPEETRKSGSRKLLRRLVTAAIAVAALSLAANQIDPLASRAEAKIPVMHEDPILQPTEPAEVSAEPPGTTQVPTTEVPTTEIPTTEVPTTEVPTTEVPTTEPEEDEFPELDMDKVLQMCLIHDLGECFTGDIPTFLKSNADADKEDNLLLNWVATLPEPYCTDMTALYAEMAALETGEAKLYKALDKLEAVIQHNESPLDTWLPLEYELNLTYGNDAVAFSPYLKALRAEVLADTQKKIAEEK